MNISAMPFSRRFLPAARSLLAIGVLMGSVNLAHAQDAAAPAEQAQPDAPVAPAEGAAPSAPAPSPETVIATVGGEEITEADLAFAAEDLSQELGQIPPAERRAFLASVLIDMKIMASAAREANMDETELFQRRLRYLEDRALRRAYFADVIGAQVTPERVQQAYDTLVGQFQPQQEVRASHILVSSEEDAQALKAELEAGADFATLARENSIDPSAQQNGGDLGFFTQGRMVPEFEQAAFAMEPGQVSDPVQSQFGWHIIRVEEKRDSAAPTLEQVAPQVQQQVLYQAFDEAMAGLKANTEVEIVDPEIAASIAASEAAGQPGQAPAGGAAPAEGQAPAEAAPADPAAGETAPQ